MDYIGQWRADAEIRSAEAGCFAAASDVVRITASHERIILRAGAI
jgi:hypothetical protein